MLPVPPDWISLVFVCPLQDSKSQGIYQGAACACYHVEQYTTRPNKALPFGRVAYCSTQRSKGELVGLLWQHWWYLAKCEKKLQNGPAKLKQGHPRTEFLVIRDCTSLINRLYCPMHPMLIYICSSDPHTVPNPSLQLYTLYYICLILYILSKNTLPIYLICNTQSIRASLSYTHHR
jgi:hypothetical protein